MRERNCAINVRVTETEKRKMESAARKCGLSLSAYLRKTGLGKEVKAISPRSFYEVYRLLTGLRDRRKQMSESEVDRAFEELVRLTLHVYHELEGESGAQAPWQ